MVKIGDKFVNKSTLAQYELKEYYGGYGLLGSFDNIIWDCYGTIKEANIRINDHIKNGRLVKVEE